MRKELDVENADDFHKYYRNQYLVVREKGVDVPFHFLGFDGGGVYGEILTSEKTVLPYNMQWEAFVPQAQFGIPALGMRNAGETVLYLYRTPERQWARGYRPQGTTGYCPNEWELLKHDKIVPTPSSREVIWQVFTPFYYKIGAAVESLLSGERIGCAISERFALVSLRRCPHPVLLHRRSFVGYWDNRVVLHKLFEELAPVIEQKFAVSVEVEKEHAA